VGCGIGDRMTYGHKYWRKDIVSGDDKLWDMRCAVCRDFFTVISGASSLLGKSWRCSGGSVLVVVTPEI
jgi:hypothetical protein